MTKKTIRHHIIASAAHDGEPGVIARSQKPAPSIKLSKEMHPVVVLVASGSTLYSFIRKLLSSYITVEHMFYTKFIFM